MKVECNITNQNYDVMGIVKCMLTKPNELKHVKVQCNMTYSCSMNLPIFLGKGEKKNKTLKILPDELIRSSLAKVKAFIGQRCIL